MRAEFAVIALMEILKKRPARRTSRRGDFLYPRKHIGAQMHPGRVGIFRDALFLSRAWYRHDVVSLMQQPGERQLRRRDAQFFREGHQRRETVRVRL